MSLARLELVQREDFSSDIVVLDLLSYTDGFNLAMEGWEPAVMEEGADLVSEALTLLVQAANDNTLSSVMQALKEKRLQAGYYAEGVDRYGVWLRAQLANETYARQALLKRLSYNQPPGMIRPNRKRLDGMILGAERYAWEETTNTDFGGSAVSSVGGTFAFNNAGGDIPARIARADLDGSSSSMLRYWMGFRSPRFGTVANFAPYWSLRKGVAAWFDADTTGGTTNVDATAKDGYKTITTFATDESMKRRVLVQQYDIVGAAGREDQRGRYQVLLRAKLSASSTTVRVRLLSGSYGDYEHPANGARVPIASTSWQFYDLGTARNPGHRMIGGEDYLDHVLFGIAAERVSGAGSLEMDCLMFVPIEEGFVFAKVITPGSGLPASVFRSADGKVFGYTTGANTAYSLIEPKAKGGLPLGSGIGVIAAERDGQSVLTDTVDVDLSVYQRWETLRGADT
jgi:hypothetical protein